MLSHSAHGNVHVLHIGQPEISEIKRFFCTTICRAKFKKELKGLKHERGLIYQEKIRKLYFDEGTYFYR